MIAQLLFGLGGAGWALPKPVIGTSAAEGSVLEITVIIPKGFHFQANPVSEPGLIPTEVSFELPRGVELEEIAYPAGTEKRVDFSPEPVRLYEGRIEIRARFSGTPGRHQIRGKLRYQPCDDAQCFRPISLPFNAEILIEPSASVPASGGETRGEREIPAETAAASGGGGEAGGGVGGAAAAAKRTEPKAPPEKEWKDLGTGETSAEEFRYAEKIRKGGLVAFLILFGLGMALNLTPCVYPLIPVTVGFFGTGVGEAESGGGRLRRVGLATVYALSLAASFALVGALAAVTGSLFGAVMSHPLVLVFVSVVMVLLGFWSLGVFELRLPGLPNLDIRSGIPGAVLLGVTAGVVAAPCVGPFLAGLFLFVAQQKDFGFGVKAFAAVGLGMAAPLALLGYLSSAVARLPKPGPWLNWIKRFFAILLFLGAVYPLLGIIGVDRALAVAGTILCLGGLWLAVDSAPGRRLFRGGRIAVGILLFLTGAFLLRYHPSSPSLVFQPWDAERTDEERGAHIVDVFAQWCVPCLEMEHSVFSDKEVARAAAGISLYRIDVTNTPPSPVRRWLEKYGVAGVPTMLFFDSTGREIRELRLVGAEGKKEFLERLSRYRKRIRVNPGGV